MIKIVILFRINAVASTTEAGAKKAPYDASLPQHKVRNTKYNYHVKKCVT